MFQVTHLNTTFVFFRDEGEAKINGELQRRRYVEPMGFLMPHRNCFLSIFNQPDGVLGGEQSQVRESDSFPVPDVDIASYLRLLILHEGLMEDGAQAQGIHVGVLVGVERGNSGHDDSSALAVPLWRDENQALVYQGLDSWVLVVGLLESDGIGLSQ